mmetsp:Transcript_42693/g.96628  ORF Transcript_42693/g.96628 Transcript_42693/m.96628 type:complete len:115 (+) Transcript_42693:1019-1363(+)
MVQQYLSSENKAGAHDLEQSSASKPMSGYLSPDWSWHLDTTSQHYYYVNLKTGTRQWEQPVLGAPESTTNTKSCSVEATAFPKQGGDEGSNPDSPPENSLTLLGDYGSDEEESG